MNRPPLLMHVRVHNDDCKFGIWLPLFLLIPLALVVLIILSPLILIATIVLWSIGWGGLPLRALWGAWVVLCSMRGLKVDVENHERHECVQVSVV